ncbi:response regulator [Aliidiomarina sp.]|uniref:response regulator n=1 Tax=Aliidiomarina sp. TaxID=1872439 RepID=UPI003A4D3E8E
MAIEPSVKDQYISTSAAAKLLGVSVGTVQHMVENGELEAWKTAGGHRRIEKSSVLQRQQLRAKLHSPTSDTPESRTRLIRQLQAQTPQRMRVLVAEDDPVTIKIYQHIFSDFSSLIDVYYARDGIEALLQLGQKPVDLLILDLDIPYVDGYEMLNKIGNNPDLQALNILIVTGTNVTESEQQQKILENISVLNKPVDRSFLRGYIQGSANMKKSR